MELINPRPPDQMIKIFQKLGGLNEELQSQIVHVPSDYTMFEKIGSPAPYKNLAITCKSKFKRRVTTRFNFFQGENQVDSREKN